MDTVLRGCARVRFPATTSDLVEGVGDLRVPLGENPQVEVPLAALLGRLPMEQFENAREVTDRLRPWLHAPHAPPPGIRSPENP